MHFIGGAAVSFTFFCILQIAKDKKLLGKINEAVSFLFVFSLVALTAILWEFAEYLVNIITGLITQNGLDDTLADLLFGLIGAPAGYLIARMAKWLE